MSKDIPNLIENGASLHEVLKAIAHSIYETDEDGIARVPDGYTEAIKAAEAQYNEIVSLSPEEIAKRTAAFNQELEGYVNPPDSVIEKRNAAVTKTMEELADWQPHSYELTWLQNEANSVLMGLVLAKTTDVIEPKEPDEWYMSAVDLAHNQLQQAITVYQNALKKANRINHTLKELDRSFTEPA